MMGCKGLRAKRMEELDADDRAPSGREWADHRIECPSCAEFEKEISHAVRLLRPAHVVVASPGFKDRVMNRAARIEQEANSPQSEPSRGQGRRRFVLWPAIAFVSAAVLFVVLPAAREWARNREFDKIPAPTLVSSAFAADEKLLVGTGIVHVVDEILIPPVENPVIASMRWLPLVEVRASGGGPSMDQLVLGTAPGVRSSGRDESWYDLSSGKFSRVIVRDGHPIFANGFDGAAVYMLSDSSASGRATRVERQLIGAGFQPPSGAAGLLGIGARFPNGFEHNLGARLKDLGRIRLWDGDVGRAMRVDNETIGTKRDTLPYLVFKIRRKDNALAEMEWRTAKESWLVIRRMRSEIVPQPGLPWNLDGIERFGSVAAPAEKGAFPAVLKDVVIPDVTLRHMVERADFESYIISPPPAWAAEEHIIDCLDLLNRPHRSFIIVYRAGDRRHVVLGEAVSNTNFLQPLLERQPVIYTSPSGNRLHDMSDGNRWAKPMLEGASYITREKPAKDCMSYIVETPAGTIVSLAVNGRVTDEERHALVDHLVPARSIVQR